VWYAWAMSASSQDTVELLGRVPVFSALSPEELEQVAQMVVPRRFEAGEVVFKEGDEGSTCYIVRSGRARAIREHPDGRSITLAHFAPGDIFGEMSMFDGGRRSATVEITEETEAIAILGADMHRLLRAFPDISVKLIAALGQRLRDTNERLVRQSFQTVQSGRSLGSGRGNGRRPGCDDHDHAGRAGAAGRLLARIGQPVPGRARARRNSYSGAGKAHRS